jgi:hypothetical protein
MRGDGMRKMVGSIAVMLVAGVLAVNAQETQRRAMAEELLNVMNMQDTIEKSFAMLKQMIPAQMETMKEVAGATNMPTNAVSHTEKMMDMLAEELSWNKMKADYITLYAETFTEQELKDTVAFYKSPAGQAFVKKQPELMKRSMEITQKLMMQITPKIQAMTEEHKKAAPPTESCSRDILTIVSYNPALPATLGVGEKLLVTIDYTIGSVEEAQIWARPYTEGHHTPGYGAHPSPRYGKGSGRLVGWFTFSQPTTVDEVRVYMVANRTDEVTSVAEKIQAQWSDNK